MLKGRIDKQNGRTGNKQKDIHAYRQDMYETGKDMNATGRKGMQYEWRMQKGRKGMQKGIRGRLNPYLWVYEKGDPAYDNE